MIENFMLDVRKNAKITGIAVLLIFLAIGIIINQVSIGNHKSDISEQSKFLELEKKRFKQYISYLELAKEGIQIMAIPAPINILFCDSNTFPGDLISSINSFKKLEISKQQKGRSTFEKSTGGVLDFSWFLLIIGSMIVMAYGWFSFGNSERMKYKINFTGAKSLWGKIILSKISLLIASLVSIILVTGLQILMNGLWTNELFKGLLSLLLVSVLCMVFLFLVSSIMGTMKNRVIGFIITVLFWFVLLFLWTKIQNSVLNNSSQPEINSIYDNEIRKMDILTNFENRFMEEVKKYKTIPERKQASIEWMEHFYDNEYKKIENIESEMIDKTVEIVKKFHFWSIFNPAAFYKSVNNELSSRGYLSYISFYRDLLQKQRRFLRFYIKNRFYENNPRVEPFLKDDEYVFKLKSRLPAYFPEGVIFNLFIIGLALFISYLRSTKVIYPIPGKKEEFSELNLNLKRGNHYKFDYESEEVPAQIYNVFMGKTGKFTGKISIDDKILAGNVKQDFIYLPSPDVFPGNVKVKKMINLTAKSLGLSKPDIHELYEQLDHSLLNKRFEELEVTGKIDILVKLAKLKKCEIYMLNNLLKNLPSYTEEEFYDGIFEELKKGNDNCLIIELNAPEHLSHAKFDFYSKIYKKRSKYEERKIKH